MSVSVSVSIINSVEKVLGQNTVTQNDLRRKLFIH